MMTSLKENKEGKKTLKLLKKAFYSTALCCHLLDNINSLILGNMSDHKSVESDKVKWAASAGGQLMDNSVRYRHVP